MFPYAMQVPGPQHILDTILQDAVDRLSWWHAWESDAKCVAQWLHAKSHRAFLQSRLAGHAADMAQALDVGCDKFAYWRWKTLFAVTRDLQRMEGVVVAARVGLR